MDYQLVIAVLDYRSAERAKAAFNHPNKEQGFAELQANPYLLSVLAWMRRAQDGRDMDTGRTVDGDAPAYQSITDEGLAIADDYRQAEMDESDAF